MLGVSAKTGKAARVDPLDPQKEAVYAWETTWRPWNRWALTLPECRWVIEMACDKYGIAAPRVTRHFTKEYPWCDVKKRVISMSRGGMNIPTCMHEAAHQIVWDYFGEAAQDHGRTFLGVFLWLLEWGAVAPRIALYASARAHKLKWRAMAPEDCK